MYTKRYRWGHYAPFSIEGRSLLAYQSWVCRDQSLYITSVSNQDCGILLAHLDPTPRWTEEKHIRTGSSIDFMTYIESWGAATGVVARRDIV